MEDEDEPMDVARLVEAAIAWRVGKSEVRQKKRVRHITPKKPSSTCECDLAPLRLLKSDVEGR